METEADYKIRLAKATKRVDSIKKFYKHLRVFIVVNIIILILKFRAWEYFDGRGFFSEISTDWMVWNLIGTPSIWGFILAMHAFYVFVLQAKPLKELGPRFSKEWEERKMKEFMDEEESGR